MRQLQERLKDYFAALSERDRRALRVGVFAVAAILVVASTATVVSNSQAAVDRVGKKRALLVDLPAVRDRSERLQRLGADAALSLEMLVKRITERHGVTATVEIQGDSSIRLQVEAAAFDAVVECLGDFEATAVIVRRATLTSAGPGRVDVDLELVKSKP